VARLLHPRPPLVAREPTRSCYCWSVAVGSEAPRPALYYCIGGDLHRFSKIEIWLPKGPAISLLQIFSAGGDLLSPETEEKTTQTAGGLN